VLKIEYSCEYKCGASQGVLLQSGTLRGYMAEEKAEASAEGAEGAEAKPKKKIKISPLQLGLALQFLVLIGAGGLIIKGSLFVKKPDLSEHTLKEKAIASLRDDESKIETVDLDDFVVNLSKTHILKAHIQVEVSNAEVSTWMKKRMPAIRSRILQLLSGQAALQSTQIEGKLLLKDAIREALNEQLKEYRHGEAERKPASVDENVADSHGKQEVLEGVVRDIYFSDFIVSKS